MRLTKFAFYAPIKPVGETEDRVRLVTGNRSPAYFVQVSVPNHWKGIRNVLRSMLMAGDEASRDLFFDIGDLLMEINNEYAYWPKTGETHDPND